ncbi:MAG TPA: ribonuclease HIII, partial [Nitrospiria bacterium]
NQWGAKDSKRLTDKRIIELSDLIRKKYLHSLVAIGPERYNSLYEKMKNLNRLLAWAHARALENLLEKQDVPRAVADQFGDERLIQEALLNKGKTIQLEQRPRAEDDPAVAAASIMARAEFLRRLEKLSQTSGVTLPKGASEKVKLSGLEILKKGGKEGLIKVAKWHFRTTREILNLSRPR